MSDVRRYPKAGTTTTWCDGGLHDFCGTEPVAASWCDCECHQLAEPEQATEARA